MVLDLYVTTELPIENARQFAETDVVSDRAKKKKKKHSVLSGKFRIQVFFMNVTSAIAITHTHTHANVSEVRRDIIHVTDARLFCSRANDCTRTAAQVDLITGRENFVLLFIRDALMLR